MCGAGPPRPGLEEPFHSQRRVTDTPVQGLQGHRDREGRESAEGPPLRAELRVQLPLGPSTLAVGPYTNLYFSALLVKVEQGGGDTEP